MAASERWARVACWRKSPSISPSASSIISARPVCGFSSSPAALTTPGWLSRSSIWYSFLSLDGSRPGRGGFRRAIWRTTRPRGASPGQSPNGRDGPSRRNGQHPRERQRCRGDTTLTNFPKNLNPHANIRIYADSCPLRSIFTTEKEPKMNLWRPSRVVYYFIILQTDRNT